MFDFIPDFVAGLGFADDAALMTAGLALVSAHVAPMHRAAAARALDKELPKAKSGRPAIIALKLRIDDHLAGDLAAFDEVKRLGGLR